MWWFEFEWIIITCSSFLKIQTNVFLHEFTYKLCLSMVSSSYFVNIWDVMLSLTARFMGPTRGPSGADRTQVGPMVAPLTLLTWILLISVGLFCFLVQIYYTMLLDLSNNFWWRYQHWHQPNEYYIFLVWWVIVLQCEMVHQFLAIHKLVSNVLNMTLHMSLWQSILHWSFHMIAHDHMSNSDVTSRPWKE